MTSLYRAGAVWLCCLVAAFWRQFCALLGPAAAAAAAATTAATAASAAAVFMIISSGLPVPLPLEMGREKSVGIVNYPIRFYIG